MKKSFRLHIISLDNSLRISEKNFCKLELIDLEPMITFNTTHFYVFNSIIKDIIFNEHLVICFSKRESDILINLGIKTEHILQIINLN